MKILLCPLASPGFAFSTIAVGRALAGRGHAVMTLTEPWLGPLLAAQGLRDAGEDPGHRGFATSAWHAPGAVARQVAQLERAVAAERPDVLLTSALALGPLIVGETAGLPVVVIGLLSELLSEADGRSAEFQAAFDACRDQVGRAPAPVARLRGDLYLRRGVPELVSDTHLVGACAWEPAAPRAVGDWLAAARRAGHRVVYVHQARSFGAPGFWPLLAGALPPDVRVAASTSRMDTAGAVAPAGALVGPVVPQRAVLSQAVAVVCSGTTAVALGALAAGVPLVTVPAGGEQHEIAALVERAGVGVSVPARDATSAGLALALSRALQRDPAPRAALRDAFSRLDGPARAADWIERL